MRSRLKLLMSFVAQPLRHIDTGHVDAVVRRRIGEELVDALARRGRPELLVLQERATHEPTHRMRHEIAAEVLRSRRRSSGSAQTRSRTSQYQIAQPVARTSRSPASCPSREARRRLVVAVDDDRLRGNRPGPVRDRRCRRHSRRRRIAEIRLQPHQRRLEDELPRRRFGLGVARMTVEPRLKPQNGSAVVSSISLRVIA